MPDLDHPTDEFRAMVEKLLNYKMLQVTYYGHFSQRNLPPSLLENFNSAHPELPWQLIEDWGVEIIQKKTDERIPGITAFCTEFQGKESS